MPDHGGMGEMQSTLIDPGNLFEVLRDSYKQIEHAWHRTVDLGVCKKNAMRSILVSGMGGSAISGDVVRNFLQEELKLPFFVNRGYGLPPWVDGSTLVILSSYSGNTEETISVFRKAMNTGANIICLTTGGIIKELAREGGFPVIDLQPGFQPRYALYNSFFSLLKILQELSIIPSQDGVINQVIRDMQEQGTFYVKEGNPAQGIAERIGDKVPVVYTVADSTDSLGMRFKGQLNENSKIHAFHNILPEMNHNEIIGWEQWDRDRTPMVAFHIRDKDDHPRVVRRFRIMETIFREIGLDVIRLESDKDSLKRRIWDLIYLTDWISYFYAVQKGRDPGEIDYIHRLKREMSDG